MKIRSKAQLNFIRKIYNGTYPSGHKGISREMAGKILEEHDDNPLPERIRSVSGYRKRRK